MLVLIHSSILSSGGAVAAPAGLEQLVDVHSRPFPRPRLGRVRNGPSTEKEGETENSKTNAGKDSERAGERAREGPRTKKAKARDSETAKPAKPASKTGDIRKGLPFTPTERRRL